MEDDSHSSLLFCSRLLIYESKKRRYVLFEYHRTVVPFVEQLDRLEVYPPYSRLLTGRPILTGGIPKFKLEFK